MDGVDKNLCGMVCSLHRMNRIEPRIVFRNASSSRLGRITLAGFVSESHGLSTMRTFGQYALVYLIDGGGRYRDAHGFNQVLVPGDLILVFPELPHLYGPEKGQRWAEFYICFDGPVFDLWRKLGLLDAREPIRHLEPVDQWLKRLEAILGAPRRAGFSPPLLEVCRLQQFLADAMTGAGKGARCQQDNRWAARACALLESELGEVDLRALARKLGAGYESFRKRFTRLLGQPPARYRMLRLVDRACELMHEGGLNDKEIARSLGFCDEFYFSRRFKQVTGHSPRQFRRRFARDG